MTSGEICQSICKRRKQLGISQRKLAELTGVSKYTITLYETGGRTPSLTTLEAICNVLKMEISVAPTDDKTD